MPPPRAQQLQQLRRRRSPRHWQQFITSGLVADGMFNGRAIMRSRSVLFRHHGEAEYAAGARKRQLLIRLQTTTVRRLTSHWDANLAARSPVETVGLELEGASRARPAAWGQIRRPRRLGFASASPQFADLLASL